MGNKPWIYDEKIARVFEGLFEIATPQTVANAFNHTVQDKSGAVYYPERKEYNNEQYI